MTEITGICYHRLLADGVKAVDVYSEANFRRPI